MRRWGTGHRIAARSLWAAGSIACARGAAADTVESWSGADLSLGPAVADVAIVDRVAHYTIRYDVINPADHPDEAEITIDLPAGGVATGFRFASRGRWLQGRLVAKGEADATFQRFEEAPFAAVRGPAVLEVNDNGEPAIRVLMVPATSRVTIEYELTAPVCYAHGSWIAALPATAVPDAGGGGAALTIHGARGQGERVDQDQLAARLGAPAAEACGQQDPGTWDAPSLAMVDAGLARGMRTELAVLDAGAARVTELTIDVAEHLAAAPRDAVVVFVVDASKSMGEAGIDAQLEVVRAYLSRAPGARFEVVLYRRKAERVFGALQPASAAPALLRRVRARALPPGNGSNLDLGLAMAADILAGARGTRRLVGFTDDHVREALDDSVAAAALAHLPADAIAHLLAVAPSDTSMYTHDFAHWLAPVAARWGGVAGEIFVGDAASETPATRADLFEELVHPRRIEAVVRVDGDGSTDAIGDVVEGSGVHKVDFHQDDAFTVAGFVWGRRWEPPMVTTAATSRRVAALAFGKPDLLASIAAHQRYALARLGGVASSVTSFLAVDPAWTPGGLPPELGLIGRDLYGMTGGVSSSGCDCTGTGSIGRVVPRVPVDLSAILRAPVDACARADRERVYDLRIELETTGREIVDVAVWSASVSDGGGDDRFLTCVTDAVWALDLDPSFADRSERFTTALRSE